MGRGTVRCSLAAVPCQDRRGETPAAAGRARPGPAPVRDDLRGRAARRAAERVGRRRRSRSRPSSSAGSPPPACRSSRRPASCTRSGCRSSPTPRSCSALLGDDGLGARLPVLVPNERGLDRALEPGVRHDRDLRQRHRDVRAARTSTAALDEQFAMFEPVVGGPAADGLRRAGLRVDVLRRPLGGRRCRSTRSSTSAGGCSTSAATQLSLGDTIGVGTAGHVHRAARGASTPPASAVDRLGRALPRHLRPGAGQHAGRAARTGSRWSTRPPAGSAAARTPRARPATSPPRTSSGRCTALGVETGVDLDALVTTSVWLAGELGRPSPSNVVKALAGG